MVTYKNIKQEPSTKILLGRLLIGLTGYNGSEIKSKTTTQMSMVPSCGSVFGVTIPK